MSGFQAVPVPYSNQPTPVMQNILPNGKSDNWPEFNQCQDIVDRIQAEYSYSSTEGFNTTFLELANQYIKNDCEGEFNRAGFRGYEYTTEVARMTGEAVNSLIDFAEKIPGFVQEMPQEMLNSALSIGSMTLDEMTDFSRDVIDYIRRLPREP
jgi:hypothetical protein